MSIDKLKSKYAVGSWIHNVKSFFDKINEIIDYLNGNGKSGDGSYKVYTGTITQEGTDAPVITICNNTLGNITWSYIATGIYIGNLPNGFPDSKKCYFYIQPISDYSGAVSVLYRDNNADNIIINTYSDNTALTTADDLLTDRSLEIRVYN